MIARRTTCPNCGQATTQQPDPAALLAAALPVLEAVEEHIERVEDWATPAASRGPAASALPSYKAMRDAFYAFRASIEAGAPLGWAVAEEPADVL